MVARQIMVYAVLTVAGSLLLWPVAEHRLAVPRPSLCVAGAALLWECGAAVVARRAGADRRRAQADAAVPLVQLLPGAGLRGRRGRPLAALTGDVVQSVELLLDEATDAEIRAQWDRLGDAGLPTARRTAPSPHHAPHVTLWAGDAARAPRTDAALPALFGDLDLELVIGSLLLFGPRRGATCWSARCVVSAALGRPAASGSLELCGVARTAAFDDGAWSPHVTLARRVAVDQVEPGAAGAGRVAELS